MSKKIKYKPQPIVTYYEPLACDTCNCETDAGEAIAVKILSYDGFTLKPCYMFVCPTCYWRASISSCRRNSKRVVTEALGIKTEEV